MKIAKILKSKTIDFNTLVLIIIGVCAYFGLDIPEDVVVKVLTAIIGVVSAVNIVIRFFTKKALSEK